MLAFLIKLEDDNERAWVLRSGFDVLKAAHDAGLVEWSKPHTLEDFARAVDELRQENLVDLRDIHATYRSPQAPFHGNEFGNSRDIRVTHRPRPPRAASRPGGAAGVDRVGSSPAAAASADRQRRR